jgi:hypothetical protein
MADIFVSYTGLCAKKAPLHENARRCTKMPNLGELSPHSPDEAAILMTHSTTAF